MSRLPVTLVTIAVAALVASGCSTTKTLTQEEAEKQISATYEQEFGAAPEEVSCPDDITAEVGKKMTCEVTVDGETIEAPITITKVEGDTVNFDIG